MTKKKLFEKIKQGHGQGHGIYYQSWLTITRKNPSPSSNQVVSWMPLLWRVAHYLSRGEFHTALLLLWLGVKDLREQFPIWPVMHPHPLEGAKCYEGVNFKFSEGLLKIADEAGIRHGSEIGSKIPYVATMDLMATTPFGEKKLYGISSKAISAKNKDMKERTLERMELERRYMESIDGGYIVANSSLVPLVLAGQLEWWFDCSSLHSVPNLLPKVQCFAELMASDDSVSIYENVENASRKLSINMSDAWILFRHCAWHQLVDIDPSVRIYTSYPIKHGGHALRSKLQKKLFGGTWK